MLHLTKGTTATIKYTATELASLVSPFFLFIFVHRATKKQVKIGLQNTSTSARFDLSSFDVDDYFDDETDGLWDYTVREKAAIDDLTETGTICETGYMYLHPVSEFEPTIYSGQTNTFEIYDAQ